MVKKRMSKKVRERIIKHYKILDLKKDIKKLNVEIETFSRIVRKAKKFKDKKNIKVFSKAIKENEKQVKKLKGYIKLIRENTNGN